MLICELVSSHKIEGSITTESKQSHDNVNLILKAEHAFPATKRNIHLEVIASCDACTFEDGLICHHADSERLKLDQSHKRNYQKGLCTNYCCHWWLGGKCGNWISGIEK